MFHGGLLANIYATSVVLWRWAPILAMFSLSVSCGAGMIVYYNQTDYEISHLSLCVRKPLFWIPTGSDTNRTVHSQKKVEI